MISSKFPKSFWSARDLVVLYDFLNDFSFFLDFQKFTKHHQVRSIPKTLRKLAWNHLTVFWFNFEKHLRFLFATVQALIITHKLSDKLCLISAAICLWCKSISSRQPRTYNPGPSNSLSCTPMNIWFLVSEAGVLTVRSQKQSPVVIIHNIGK